MVGPDPVAGVFFFGIVVALPPVRVGAVLGRFEPGTVRARADPVLPGGS